MERTVTRHDLASALIHILEANGVPHPENAVEVLGSPGNGTQLFVVIPSERAKVALVEKLMKITSIDIAPLATSGYWTKPKVWRWWRWPEVEGSQMRAPSERARRTRTLEERCHD